MFLYVCIQYVVNFLSVGQTKAPGNGRMGVICAKYKLKAAGNHCLERVVDVGFTSVCVRCTTHAVPRGQCLRSLFFEDHAEVVPLSIVSTAMIKPLVGCMTGLITYWSGVMVARVGLIVMTRRHAATC